MMEDAEVLAFLREQAGRVRFLTSVCTGALILGAAGLLRGKRATTHWASHDLLGAFGAIPTKGRVVRDGNLITGGGVTAGIDFALTVVAELAGGATAQGIQLQIEVRTGAAVRCGHTGNRATGRAVGHAPTRCQDARRTRGSRWRGSHAGSGQGS